VITLNSLEELPALLVRARTVANMTQRALADRLDVSEQQVQRDERTVYAGASLSRLIAVAQAIGLDIRLQATLPAPAGVHESPSGRRASSAV
jgi:transcriptional regulator with XRE-family HTH domain